MSQQIVREYYIIIKQKISSAHFDSAMNSIDKLLANFPNDEHGYYYKGVCEFAKEKYKEALKSFSCAIKINPAHAKAYFNLGATLYILKQVDLALINIAKALLIFTKRKELDKKQRCLETLMFIEKERKK